MIGLLIQLLIILLILGVAWWVDRRRQWDLVIQVVFVVIALIVLIYDMVPMASHPLVR